MAAKIIRTTHFIDPFVELHAGNPQGFIIYSLDDPTERVLISGNMRRIAWQALLIGNNDAIVAAVALRDARDAWETNESDENVDNLSSAIADLLDLLDIYPKPKGS